MESHTKKTAILSVGQLAGTACGLAIPLFLSRFLALQDYGTYKQLILMQGIFLLTVQLGLDAGLFYFIRRHPEHPALFSLNACLAEFVLCLGLGGGLIAGGARLGAWLHSPQLPAHMPAFALLVLFSVPAQHFEYYLNVLDRIGLSVRITLLQEVGKVFAVIGGFYFFHSLQIVLLAMAGISAIKLFSLVGFNLARRERQPWDVRWAYFLRQARFGLPFGFASLVNALLKLDKFVVSAMFNLKEFTLYTVGCFEVPWVPGVGFTLSDLMSFDMVAAERAGDRDRSQRLWRDAKLRTALLQFPAACFLVAFAGLLIPLLFSPQYAASSRYFRVFALTLLLGTFDSDILFRSFAKNPLHLKLTLLSVIYTLAAVAGAAWYFGPLGALVAKVGADAFTSFLKLRVARHLLSLSWSRLFAWGKLLQIGLVSGVGAWSAFALSAHSSGWPRLLLGMGIDSCFLLGCGCVLGVFTGRFLRGRDDEKDRAKAPRRTLHLVEFLEQGGIERMLESIVQHTPRERATLSLFSYETDSLRGVGKQIADRGIPVYYGKKAPGYDWKLVERLGRLIREKKIDVIHTHDFGPMEYAVALKIRFPHLVLVHTQHTLHHFVSNRRYVWLFQAASFFYFRILCVSPHVESQLARRCPWAKRKLRTVFNGVDLDRLRPEPEDLPRPPLRLLSVSRISPEKNLLHTLETCRLLKQRGIAFSLHHAGSGSASEEAKVREFVSRHGLSEEVHFHGFLDDVRPLLARGNVFISSSFTEGHPVAVLEAMASGKICLLSEIPAHTGLDSEALLFFPLDAESLAVILGDLASDPGKYRSYAEKARAVAAARFSIARTVEAYCQTYEQAL
jgi:glycosyltransferase involved in cell wall biosynthesis/O-antigen/teichoic acid export membrane protein